MIQVEEPVTKVHGRCRSIRVVPARRGIITVDRKNHQVMATRKGKAVAERLSKLKKKIAHLELVVCQTTLTME